MSVRDVVVAGLILAVVGGVAEAAAQAAPEPWRTHYAAGEEARAAGDDATYATEMAAAADAIPSGLLNRPFLQYHAARAAALAGRPDEAVRWLRTAWDEEIESLMISFASYDPAFSGLRGTAAFEGVMSLAAEMTLETRPLGGGIHLISGAGSNLVVSVGDDGVLLVDTGYGPALPALRRALAGLDAAAPSVVVLTHPHEDHMGSAAALGADAVLLAHPGTEAAMREPYEFMEGVSLPPKPPEALPDVLVSADTSFAFNGETVSVVPTPAHTGADLSVFFEGAGVVHLGDTYLAGNPMMYPGTEDPRGFLDRLDALLDTMPPGTVVVGGHEEVADLAAVRAQIDASRACMAFVEEAFGDGLELEEVARLGADRFPVPWIAFFYGYFAAN